MLCRDYQESVASARCQGSITVILFHADISSHPLFPHRYALFQCQLVTRDAQYRIAEKNNITGVYILVKNDTVETLLHLFMFKKKAI